MNSKNLRNSEIILIMMWRRDNSNSKTPNHYLQNFFFIIFNLVKFDELWINGSHFIAQCL